MTAKQNRNPQPKFFWQGVGIVLPVVVLSAVGLALLRQDERATEQDARTRAGESAQVLARTMRSSVDEELQRFQSLQNAWTTWLRLAVQGEASAAFPEASVNAELEKWERDYPELKLPEWAVPQGEILSDGQPAQPPPIPAAPAPPQWFCALAPEQRKLWENLRAAVATKASPEACQAASQAFLGTHPSADATQAAAYLAESPEQILRNRRIVATEAGISFQDIACCQLLWATNAPLSGPLLEAVSRQLSEHPSFVAPTLLEMTERRTNGADDVICQKVRRLQQFWHGQSKAREWLDSLRQLPELSNGALHTPWAHWVAGPTGDALALCGTSTPADTNAAPAAPAARGCSVCFIPQEVAEAIFKRTLAENKFLVPAFARAAVTVAGKRLIESGNPASASAQSLLGSATQKIMFGQSDAARFDLSFYLTSREEMLSSERLRANVFAALILAAFLAALAGLLAAWRAFRRQLQLNELKSNFVSSVSHELCAPIASMRLMAENLELGAIVEPQKQIEYFRFIGQEGRRLSSLIENVLDFSRIEQGRKQYELEPTDLAALVGETVKLMTPYAAEKGVQIVLRKKLEPQDSELNLDGRAIQQALVNLIDNAVKHSRKGETVCVELSAGRAGAVPEALIETEKPASLARDAAVPNEAEAIRTGRARLQPSRPQDHDEPPARQEPRPTEPRPTGTYDAVYISVQDHGEGIPAEEHEKIFERFYRRGSELRRKTPGVGIGLSIVKHIIEAHNGRIHVRSAVGQGSRFVIELPLKPQK